MPETVGKVHVGEDNVDWMFGEATQAAGDVLRTDDLQPFLAQVGRHDLAEDRIVLHEKERDDTHDDTLLPPKADCS